MPSQESRPRKLPRISRRRVVLGSTALAATLVMGSMVPYLIADSGEGMAVRVATWARDHKLGGLVDLAESIKYSDAPPDVPASALSSADGQDDASATPIASLVAPPPEDLKTVVQPALKREGEWRAVAYTSDSAPAVWVTGMRPSQKMRSVTATYMVIDQTSTRAAMFNGPEIPGGSDWKRGRRIPKSVLPDTLAAFNGGFRKEHSMGGYYTENREVWPLKKGMATLAIDKTGHVLVGEWGRDFKNRSEYVSIRQNLPLLVDGGKPMHNRTPYWGAEKNGNMFILRSAVCERSDGRLLFAVVGKVDAKTLALALVNAGCVRAMELDVNSAWPKGYVFKNGEPRKIDARITGREDLYVSGSYKEFFAFFDATSTAGAEVLK